MTDLNVHRYGDPQAKPVVLVHGLTDAGTVWPDLVDHWGDRWDIHAPDLRGHGHSPRFTAESVTRAHEVLLADLVELLDSFTERVALVGHSLGAVLSLRATLQRPDRVRALVLEDPPQPSGFTPNPVFVADNERLLDAVAADPDGEIQRMLRETPWSRAEVEAWAACKAMVDRDYVRHGLFLGDPTWDELFEQLAVPTVLIVPETAPMAALPNHWNPLVRTVAVPGAGHCVRRDRPADYTRAVDGLLAEVDGAV